MKTTEQLIAHATETAKSRNAAGQLSDRTLWEVAQACRLAKYQTCAATSRHYANRACRLAWTNNAWS